MKATRNQRHDFEIELNRLRSDFDCYTEDVRTKSVKFHLALLAVAWAIYGKPFSDGKTFYEAITSNAMTKYSIFASVSGLLLTVGYSFCFALHLKYWDHKLQRDFEGDRLLFKERMNSNSCYPYHRWVARSALGVDGLVLLLCGLSAWFLWQSLLK